VENSVKALLVYPQHLPLTYWSFSGAVPYVERRAALPPLGLVPVAAMLPQHWDLRLIDMNDAPLRDSDILRASFRRDVDRIRVRYVEARRRAGPALNMTWHG
jgi:hypothetical protein